MRHRRTVVLLGMGASAIFMYLAVRRLDYAHLVRALAGVRIFPWIPLAVLSYMVGHLVRGLRCRLLLSREADLPLFTAANVVVVGYAANNVFPARLGELVRAGMLSERTGIPIAQSLTVTFIERVLDGLAILALLVLGLGLTEGAAPGWTHDIVRIASIVFGSASLALVVAIHAPGLVVATASRIGNKLPAGWHDRLVKIATSVTNGGACLRRPRDAALLGTYSLVVWLLEAGLFLGVLRAFGLPPSLSLSAIAMSVTNLGLLLPSSPGFIGPFHYFCSRALMAHGIEETTALACAAIVHLTFYVPVTVWGAIAMLWYGVEVGATAAMTRAARVPVQTTELRGLLFHEIAPLPPHARPTSTPPFMRALVEAMVVPEGRAGDPVVLADTADFVHGELEALRPRLRLLLRTGMAVFRLATRLRYLRGYCNLPLETRRAWTAAWSNGPFVPLRRLMKPAQATALLGYYDHVTVTGGLVELATGPGAVRAHADDPELRDGSEA